MTETKQPRDIWWWYWVLTLVSIAAALAGWWLGYGLVIGISIFQLCHSLLRNRSLASFPVQIRFVYLAVTLFGLWEGPRLFVFALLLVGTFLVVFKGRCGIALVLKRMPWNQGRELRLN